MATTTSHNKKSSSVKRILSEARELSSDPSTEYTAAPLEDNIFEWHYTLRGPSGTEFEKGIYHGRILLPAEYPFRPPHLMVLTPNGRWECGKKICLTFTGFHEEMWQPAWGIRTALLGIQTFMSAKAEAAAGVGSLEYPKEQREKLAEMSRDWTCPTCNKSNAELIPAAPEGGSEAERKVEQLPEGLSVDLSGNKKAEEEKEASGSKVKENEADGEVVPTGSEGHANQEGTGSEDVERAALAVDEAAPTIAASSSTASVAREAQPFAQAPPSAPAEGSTLVRRHVGGATPAVRTNDAAAPALAPAAVPALPAAPQPAVAGAAPAGGVGLIIGTSPSERYLAVLDRAIATVVLLLGALVVRMLLL